MTKSTLNIIIGLMAAALVGIMSMQVYWIGKAMELGNRQFAGDVNDALNQVVLRLEQEEVDNFFVFASSGTKIDIREGFMVVEEESQENISVEIRADLSHPSDTHYIKRIIKKKTNQNGEVEEDVQIEKHGEWHELTPPGLSEHLLHTQNDRIMQIFSRTLQGAASPNRSLRERIDPDHLDSLIAESLNDQGIDLGFAFMVTRGRGANVVYKTSQSEDQPLIKSKYKVRMFPSLDPFGGNLLSIHFPNQSLYALRSVWLLVLGSVLFTSIILGCFWMTVRALLKQKKVSEMKNDFINNMTHEFKTPLATISLATDALNNPMIQGNSEKSAYYTGIIKEENQRMNQQVERVLQIARSEIQLRKTVLDAHQLIHRAVEKIQLHVEQRNGVITTDLRATNTSIEADEVHLRNLIQNLLENANKYSPESPLIDIATFNEENELVIEVSDKGLGISQADQGRVFERFFRVSTGNLHDVKGFGLGLSYVREIVEAHGGNISVRSKLGEGSVFSVRLPIK